MGVGKALFRVVSEVGGNVDRLSKEATMLRNTPTGQAKTVAEVVGGSNTNITKNSTTKLSKQDRAFNSVVKKYTDTVKAFNATYDKAIKRGSASDNNLKVLGDRGDYIRALDDELKQFKAEGYDGVYPDSFQPPKDYLQPKHYVPIDVEAILGNKPKTVKVTPDPLDLGKGFRTETDPAYAKQADIDRNAQDPTMGDDYRAAANDTATRAKDTKFQENVHQSVIGAKFNPDVEEILVNNTGLLNGKFAEVFSFMDKYAKVIGDNVFASKILSNAARGINSSAMHYKTTVLEETKRLTQPLSRLYGSHIGASMFDSPNAYKSKMEKKAQLDKGLTERLLINAQEYSSGATITQSSDAAVQQLVDEFVKSDYNKYVGKKLNEAGIQEDVNINPYKIQANFSHERIVEIIESGALSYTDVYTMLGKNAIQGNAALKLKLEMFLGTDKIYQDVGEVLFKKIEDAAREGGVANFTPIKAAVVNDTLDETISDLLDKTLNRLFEGSGRFNESFKWDFKSPYISAKGKSHSLVDFMDTDIFGNLETFNQRASGLYGLSQTGLMVRATIDDLTDVQKLALEKKEIKLSDIYVPINSEARFARRQKEFLNGIKGDSNIKEVKDILDNVQHMVMGRATGESIPHALQAAGSLASMTVLGNSAIYNTIDWGTMIATHGFLNVVGTVIATLPASQMWRFIGGKMTKAEAEEGLAILMATRKAGDNTVQSFSRFAGNPKYNNSRFYETIAYMGQQTPLWNGSELVRRQQLYVMSRLLDKEMLNLAKGGKGNKSLYAKLKRSGVPDEQIEKWAEGIKKFGRDTSKWSAEYTPNRFEVEMSGIMDKGVMKVTGGELPDFLQNSSVGKAILPFMAAQMSLTNSLLRNVTNQGAIATMEMLGYQAPFAVAAVYLKEIAMGRDPQNLSAKEFIFSYLTSLPTMGGAGILFSLMNQSEGGRGLQASSTAFTYINNVAKLIDKVGRGEAYASDLTKVFPLISVNPIIRGFISTVHSPDYNK